MKRSRFTEEQIIGILKDHQAGRTAKELCRKHGISDATFYKWRSKYGGMEVSDARKLKSLEDENRKLKKLLAELMLDQATLREMLGKKLLTPGSRKSAVTWAIRQRRAIRSVEPVSLVGLDPKAYRRKSERPDDAPRVSACASWRTSAAASATVGCISCSSVKAIGVNHKKLFRLYREERLMVRKRGGRKRALGTRAPMPLPQGAEPTVELGLRLRHVDGWPALPRAGSGRRLHAANVSALVADNSISGVRVARELDRIVCDTRTSQGPLSATTARS